MKGYASDLLIDMENRYQLPHRFRRDDGLRMSGSAQYSKESLKAILEELPKEYPIIFVNLREESHGYVNGMAVCWYGIDNAENSGKSLQTIEVDEKKRFKNLLYSHEVAIRHKGKDSFNIDVSSAETQNQVIAPLVRFPITDHRTPSPELVDQFIRFVQSLDQPTWLHFNCRKGSGRTTTFMSMYEMMHQAHIKRFEEIIEKQSTLGESDFVNLLPNEPHKHPYKLKRLRFLKQFYTYCKECGPDFTTPWSAWLVGRANFYHIFN